MAQSAVVYGNKHKIQEGSWQQAVSPSKMVTIQAS